MNLLLGQLLPMLLWWLSGCAAGWSFRQRWCRGVHAVSWLVCYVPVGRPEGGSVLSEHRTQAEALRAEMEAMLEERRRGRSARRVLREGWARAHLITYRGDPRGYLFVERKAVRA